MEHFKAEGAQLQNKSNVIPFTPPNMRHVPIVAALEESRHE